MSYPIKAVLVILLVSCLALIVEVTMVFLRLQYTYYRYSAEENITHTNGSLNPCGNDAMEPDTKNKINLVQKKSARVATYCSLIAGCLGLGSIILSGIMSDRFGRKPVIIVAFLGILLTAVFTGLIILLNLPIWMFYVAVIPNGLFFHGFMGLFSQVLTCTTDMSVRAAMVPKQHQESLQPTTSTSSDNEEWIVRQSVEGRAGHKLTTAHHRLVLLGVYDGAVGMMYALTQTFVGEIISMYGFDVPVYIAFILSAITIIVLIIMPETKIFLDSQIPVIEPSATNVSVASGDLQSSSGDAVKTDMYSFVTPAVAIGIVISLLNSGVASDSSVTTLYLMGQPFCWDPAQVGVFCGIRSGAGSLAIAVISIMLVFCFHCNMTAPEPQVAVTMNDDINLDSNDEVALISPIPSTPHRSARWHYLRITLYLAGVLFLLLVSRLLFGMAFLTPAPTHIWMVYISLFISMISFYTPVMKSLLSGCVKPEEQGKLFSLSGCAEALGMMLGMTLQPVLYSSTLFFSGTVFLVGAGILGLSIALVGCMGCLLSRQVAV